MPAGALLAGAARRYGDRVAFRHHDAELSFTDLWQRSCRFANALGGSGVEPGDVVGFHLPNCLAFPVAYYGTLLAGAVFSPANPLLPTDDLAKQFADSGARFAVTAGTGAGTLSAIRDRTRIETIAVVAPEREPAAGAVEFEQFLATATAPPPTAPLDPGTDLAHLAYTGGTTGRSKGVRVTHHNVVVNALQSACWGSGSLPALDADGGLTLDQVGPVAEWPTRLGTGIVINLTPFFHAMGTIGALNVPVLAGSTVVLHDRLDPRHYLADAERFGVTSIGGAPALFAALLACPDLATRDLRTVRSITSGAAPLPTEMINALNRHFPDAVICEGYGLTEVTMAATLSPAARSGTRKVGAVGVPVFDTEVKIVPADGGEEPLRTGAPGEVCVRGPQVTAGYHGRPEATADVLVDGWLHTGDIGILDEDGYLSVVDRKKDMLIYKGYNVYPRELEELLTAHPSVAMAAVVGRPDPAVGDLPVAFVVPAGGSSRSESELMAAINEHVAPYKRLRELRYVDRLPVSAAGKILKRELRDELSSAG